LGIIILNWQELKKILDKKRIGKKIVFTNGCFDIIHAGHISYLEKARSLGDILVVGVNSDESVKRLKGENRPVNKENDRLYILSAIRYIDFVTLFTEDTPYNLIKTIVPDILVKGGDWNINDIVGKDIVEKNNGKVIAIDYLNGYSTTSILEKINRENS
jgi:rfaE bifunctional protein nucleotidyltransferase chain/domain